MDKLKDYFTFNKLNSIGRKEGLYVENFLNDLKTVFEKHQVTSIKNGFVGFDKKNRFGITNADIDMSEKTKLNV